MSYRALSTLLLIATACAGSDDGVPAQRDGGSFFVDAGRGGDGGSSAIRDAGPPDAGDRFDDAPPLTRGTAADGLIRPAGRRDLYAVEGEAGEFLQILVEPTFVSDDPPRFAVRLYDASRFVVAQSATAFPDFPRWTETRIIVRLPQTGRYFIEVMDRNDYLGETPLGSNDHGYRLSVTPHDPARIDAELGDDATTANVITPEMIPDYHWCGDLDDPDDVDVYRFVGWSARTDTGAWFGAPSPSGNGSTLETWTARFTSASETTTYARRELGDDLSLVPRLGEAQDVLLWISRGATSAGTNNFYCFAAVPSVRLPNADVEPNDEPANASPIRLNADAADRNHRSAFFTTRLTGDDVDHFSFESAFGDTVTVRCSSESEGTGVRGLHIAVGAVGATETSTGAHVEDVALTAPRSILRITKRGQAPDVDGDYVDCFLDRYTTP